MDSELTACPNCSYENSITASFCLNCGFDLAQSRTPPPPIPLRDEVPLPSPRAHEAERRFVTMLFADLSGFTALSETRDPEAMRELINACFDRFVPIVENYQGVVDQFVGDALVALFGAPIAHEDDPAQACRAALDLREAIRALNADFDTDLDLHIGINSGIVLAGGIGSRGRQQYSVLGNAVNLGSRLEDAADRGEIFVGAETYKLTRDRFEYVSRGAMSFRGKSEPQAVWQLLRARPDVIAHRRVQTTAPLLGRERELALLHHVTDELTKDEAGLRVVSILGDAGVGKTRLVLEWAAAEPQTRFVIASAPPDSALRAYAMLGELARALLGGEQVVSTSSAALDALLGIQPSGTPLEEMDGAVLETHYAHALRELIARRAAEHTRVIICEDLHWADAPSIQVLQHALTHLLDARVLLAFTSRADVETPGWALMDALPDLPGVSALQLHLTPLAEQEAHTLLESLMPGQALGEIEKLVLAHAEGNPLFIEELVQMLVERGDLERVNEEWIVTRNPDALDVPNTLQGVLMARVDQLGSDARHVLQIASVLGREFPLDVLERMIGRIQN